MRFSWVCYGDFPVFRKDMRQLLARPYQDGAQVEGYFAPWERRAQRYGERFDPDVLMRTDLETYLSENCLVKTDRASMLASLEVRVPYLDETVLDRILPLPAKEKLRSGQLKRCSCRLHAASCRRKCGTDRSMALMFPSMYGLQEPGGQP